MLHFKRSGLFSFLWLFFCCNVYGLVPLRLHRVTSPIRLDGKIDESGWTAIDPLPLVMYAPRYGGKPTEKTEIRVAYDDNFLYASARCLDSDPAGVRTNSLYRDKWRGDDTFEIILDTLNDKQNAFEFTLTPAGTRIDAAISNNAEYRAGDPFNPSWNAIWDVATTQTKEGWFAEVRIPFTSLRFRSDEGRVVMGLIAFRYISRKSETLIFPAIEPHSGEDKFKPSLAREIELDDIRAQTPIAIAPYALGGFETKLPTKEAGVDLKYGIKSDLTIDLTANTDFAQVESDDQQINLSRFDVFFPEKRLFFQDRASLFEFGTGGLSRVFHSRRIGINDDGDPIRIFGGARVVGTLAGWDLGLLDMQTDRDDTRPSENFGVLRMRRPVLNADSYAGAIFSSRLGTNGAHNFTYGTDAFLRVLSKDYLTLNVAQTSEQGSTGSLFDASLLRAQWERPGNRGIGYRSAITYQGPHYNPGMGFLERTDFTSIENRVTYGWYPAGNSSFRRHLLFFRSMEFLRTEDRSLESAEIKAGWELETSSSHYLYLGVLGSYENLREPLALADTITVPPGSYSFGGADIFYGSPWGKKIGTELEGYAGPFYDGQRFSVSVRPRWLVSSHLDLSGEYQLNHLVFGVRNAELNTHLGRFRLNAALNTKISLSSFLQYNSAEQNWNWNLRFRYSPREGNDLYLVYNQLGGDDNPSDNIRMGKTFLVKYVYTFNLSG